MFTKENDKSFYNKNRGNQLNGCGLRHRSYLILIYLIIIMMCFGFSFACFHGDVDAATVYGHVYCSNGMACPQNITLLIYMNGQLINRVRTDHSKNYRIFLHPGEYEVIMNLGGESWGTNIRSSSNPIRQDIHPYRKTNGRR